MVNRVKRFVMCCTSTISYCDMRNAEGIAENPVRAGLVDSPEKFPCCFTYLAKKKAAGAKARLLQRPCGMAEAMP